MTYFDFQAFVSYTVPHSVWISLVNVTRAYFLLFRKQWKMYTWSKCLTLWPLLDAMELLRWN